ncbi:MAG: hypothetical protein RL701_2996 [Pseudomonadota bacterium]
MVPAVDPPLPPRAAMVPAKDPPLPMFAGAAAPAGAPPLFPVSEISPASPQP